MQKPVILMYHRIAVLEADPWQLAVTPGIFEEQLSVLRKIREPFPIIDFLDALERGDLPGNAVAVTFDDGYFDNLQNAKPHLTSFGVPAVVFVVTGSVGARKQFWWDELTRLILGYRGKLNQEICICGECLHVSLENPSNGAVSPWQDWRRPRTAAEALYLEIWRRLQSAPSTERERVMSLIRGMFPNENAPPEDLPMTATDLRELTRDGLVTIGAHSVTHPNLTTICKESREKEIAESKRYCETVVGGVSHGFAYPHGAYDIETRAMVRNLGFRFACSTRHNFIDENTYDLFALPRLHVMNWSGHVFERMLS